MHAGAVMRSTMHSDTDSEFDRYREKDVLFQMSGAM
jgi:hypothetical protein